MSCVVRRIAAWGEETVETVDYHTASLADAARYEPPDGVYAAFGTWHARRVVLLSRHFDRFEDSAQRVGFTLRLDRGLVRRELCSMLTENGIERARIRISAHPENDAADGTGPSAERMLTAVIEPYDGPFAGELRSARERGVSCATMMRARESPRAKQFKWLAERSSHQTSAYERLLVDPGGAVLEGASSNFYAIVSDAGHSSLRTAEEGVLHGIARSIVLDAAAGLIEHVSRPVSVADLPALREAFLSSASRGVIPIVSIDGSPVGNGRPGPFTGEIMKRYDERAHDLEEPLC